MTEAARASGVAPPLALRTGLPFGAVMATGVSSQVARALQVSFAVTPLLWIAVAETLFITGRGLLRHRAEFRAPLTSWTRLGPPGDHTGILTVPIGLAVTTAGLAAQTSGFATGATLAGLVLTWAATTLFAARFLGSLAKGRPDLASLGGDWFLAPAALLATTIASVASLGHTGAAATVVLWAGLVAAVIGVAGYWALTVAALVRVSRLRLGGSRRILWWIWAGCGGLAGAATSALVDVGTPFGSFTRSVLRDVTTATWVVGLVVFLPVVVLSTRFMLSSRTLATTFPWPPTFSTAVIAIGALDVGRLAQLDAVSTAGRAVGYATLMGWTLTAVWNLRSLLPRGPHGNEPSR